MTHTYTHTYICRAGHDTQKMYNRYNYNYTLFSYNRYYYNYFKKNNSRYNYKYRIFLVGEGRVLWPIFVLPYKKQNISY